MMVCKSGIKFGISLSTSNWCLQFFSGSEPWIWLFRFQREHKLVSNASSHNIFQVFFFNFEKILLSESPVLFFWGRASLIITLFNSETFLTTKKATLLLSFATIRQCLVCDLSFEGERKKCAELQFDGERKKCAELPRLILSIPTSDYLFRRTICWTTNYVCDRNLELFCKISHLLHSPLC